MTNSFTNVAAIVIPVSQGPAQPYPSAIQFSGLPGTVSRVSASINNFSHTFPDDVSVLLVGPGGQKVMLMSHAGGGNAVAGVNLTFDDSAAGSLPDSTSISPGTFKPTAYFPPDHLPAPAPVSPYPTVLSGLSGVDPNGNWLLYVYDESAGDGGSITRGWQLNVVTTNVTCCPGTSNADMSITVTDSPDPATVGSNLIYSILVLNSGATNATGVLVTNLLPASASFVSTSMSQGTATRNGSAISWNLGNLAVGASATASIVATPTNAGTITNVATVRATQTDPNSANNTATTVTTVNPALPALSISDASVVEGNVVATNLTFKVTLSRASSQTVTVDYTSVNNTATAGSDYTAAAGTLSFAPGITNQSITIMADADTNAEPDETLFVDLSNPLNATIARSRGTGTILNDDGLPSQVDHFMWNTVTSPQFVQSPFAVTVTAKDAANNTVSNFAGPVTFRGIQGTGPPVSVLITEVSTANGQHQVEFANLSGFALDLSGWLVSLYDNFYWPDPDVTFVFPQGAVCPAGGVFVLDDSFSGSYPGTYPNFFTGTNVFWFSDSISNQVAVLLRNAAGQIADFFCAVDAFPSQISNPLPISTNQWQGAPVTANTNSSPTYQRVGSSDQNSSADWVLAGNSVGALNSGLTSPFPGNAAVPISPGTTGSFTNGVWGGNLAVLQAASGVTLRADDGNGHAGSGNSFAVNPAADLSVAMSGPATVPAGQQATYTLRITNLGPSTATAVTLVNTLPAGASFVAATNIQGACNLAGNMVTCGLGSLASNAAALVTVVVTYPASGTFTNSASVSSAVADLIASNNTARTVTTVTASSNSPPFISAITNRTINQNSSAGPIAFTIGDAETLATNLVVSGNSTDLTLVPTNNLVFGGSGSNRTVTVTPATNRSGSATITVTVIDPQGASASSSFLLTVVAPITSLPSLQIFQQLPGVVVTWPSFATNFDLQFADAITSNALWQMATNTPAVLGSNFVVTNNSLGTIRFFRLKSR